MKSKHSNSSTIKNAQLSYANHLLCGGGGVRAVLATLGVFLSFELAGLRFRSIGGISGGAIPAALLASGMNIREMLKFGLNLDFRNLLVKRGGGLVSMDMLSYRLSNRRPPRGLYESSKLGDFINNQCKAWPSRYWTASFRLGESEAVTTGKVKGNWLKFRLLDRGRKNGRFGNELWAFQGF